MTDGGTMDTTPVVIVAVGDTMATREAMHARVMVEAMPMKDMAEPTRAVDIAVEKASMEEAGSTAAGSMEVDVAKR